MSHPITASLLFVVLIAAPGPARAADATYHHVHLNVPNPEEAAQWYIKHMDCQARPGRANAAQCGSEVYLAFYTRPAKDGSDGTAVNHIGFSFHDLTAKMKELEAAGVKVVTPLRDAPGLFKLAFVEDPWGTRIEIVEDHEYIGFHHLHLRARDPEQTLKWYQTVFGGNSGKPKGRLDGLLYGKTWLLVTKQAEGEIAPTEGRSIEHLGSAVPDLDRAATELKQKGVKFQEAPRALTNGPVSKISFVVSPDGVRIEVVQP
jgi:catechol 2,3-dioxygenase-like lactoylglutathione lyase family enzyme